MQWRTYDTHFHIKAAATGLRQWSKYDTYLYTTFFTGCVRAASCSSICDITLLQAADCPRKPCKREGGKAPLSPPPVMFKKKRQWSAMYVLNIMRRGVVPSKIDANLSIYVVSVGSSTLPGAV